MIDARRRCRSDGGRCCGVGGAGMSACCGSGFGADKWGGRAVRM